MKIISEAVRMMIFIAIVSTITSHLDRFCRNVSSVQYLLFNMDESLSSNTIDEIKSYTYLLRCNGRYNPTALMDHLPKRFNCIESVELRSLPHNTAQISIKAHEPLVSISEKKLMTRDGIILSHKIFDKKILNNIDEVAVVNEIPQAVRSIFVNTIAQAQRSGIIDKYSITWVDEHHINLTDRHDPHVSIVCSPDKLPDASTQQKCAALVLNKLNEKPNAYVKADIRFDDQIILSSKGGQHGAYS